MPITSNSPTRISTSSKCQAIVQVRGRRRARMTSASCFHLRRAADHRQSRTGRERLAALPESHPLVHRGRFHATYFDSQDVIHRAYRAWPALRAGISFWCSFFTSHTRSWPPVDTASVPSRFAEVQLRVYASTTRRWIGRRLSARSRSQSSAYTQIPGNSAVNLWPVFRCAFCRHDSGMRAALKFCAVLKKSALGRRQGKRPDGCWSDVSEEIEIFGVPSDTHCWRFWPKAQ